MSLFPDLPPAWLPVVEEETGDFRIFRTLRRRLRHALSGHEDDFFVIKAFDWAIALALDENDRLLLVNQFRYGAQKHSWEFPAGLVEAGESPLEAGRRELMEETGFAGSESYILGQCHPNPAIQDNLCTFLLFTNVHQIQQPSWEGHEEMAALFLAPTKVEQMMVDGTIHHAIVMAAWPYFTAWWRLHRPNLAMP
jgi:ADP-ribose pyrophosphatase